MYLKKQIGLLSGTEEKIRWVVQIRVNRSGVVSFPDMFQQDMGRWHREYRDKNRKLVQQKEREYYARTILNQRWRKREETFFRKVTKQSMGICWECGNINWDELQQHHPYPKKMPKFKVTMCANCHARMHWYLGNGIREKNNEQKR